MSPTMGEESHVAVITENSVKKRACHTACHSVSQRVTLDCVLFAYPTLICAETICKPYFQPPKRSVSHTVSHRVTLFCVLGLFFVCFLFLFFRSEFLNSDSFSGVSLARRAFACRAMMRGEHSLVVQRCEASLRLSRNDARDEHAAQPANATMRRNDVVQRCFWQSRDAAQ